MLTVREALRLPILQTAALVAGEKGLDKPVRWVHIVDLPRPKFEWVQGGELLLTSGYGLSEDEQDPIPMLAARGLAGIVLSLGEKFVRTPPNLLQAGDRHDLPIIEAPPDLAFIKLTEAILREILAHGDLVRKQSDDIQRALMDQVLEGASLQGVAEGLAGILARSITVESETFDVLAAAEAGPVDEARVLSVQAGRTGPELARQLLKRGIYARLLEERRPIRVPPIPELGMTMERIVAPVFVAHKIVGYVWIISGDRALTELDEQAIEHAATVTAVILLKQREARRAELARREHLLNRLLDPELKLQPSLVDQVERIGFRSDRAYQVLVIDSPSAEGELPEALPRNVERWLDEVNGPGLVSMLGGLVVMVMQDPIATSLAERLVDELSHPSLPLRVGVGGSVADVSQLHRSYRQAREALQLAGAHESEGAFTFEKLGMLHWLHNLPDEVVQENAYFQAVQELDSAKNHELLRTLESYLRHGGRLSQAARNLEVHRNTLAYRLRRIEALLELDLSEPTTRLELFAALQAYRLQIPER